MFFEKKKEGERERKKTADREGHGQKSYPILCQMTSDMLRCPYSTFKMFHVHKCICDSG